MMSTMILLLIPAAIGYSPPLAMKLNYMSAIAYEDTNQINNWSCNLCDDLITDINVFQSSDSSIQGFTGYYQPYDAIIVSFRGSDNLKNWISNFNFFKTRYYGNGCFKCYIHRGFNKCYQSVGDIVKTQVKKLRQNFSSAKVLITGHSLGGALACLASIDIYNSLQIVPMVYTFGQPRVGNKYFARYVSNRIPETYRVINYADIAAHVPPRIFRYVHFGRQVWYNPRGMENYDLCRSEHPYCANSVRRFSFSDHKIENYLKMKVSGSLTQQTLEQVDEDQIVSQEYEEEEEEAIYEIQQQLKNQQ